MNAAITHAPPGQRASQRFARASRAADRKRRTDSSSGLAGCRYAGAMSHDRSGSRANEAITAESACARGRTIADPSAVLLRRSGRCTRPLSLTLRDQLWSWIRYVVPPDPRGLAQPGRGPVMWRPDKRWRTPAGAGTDGSRIWVRADCPHGARAVLIRPAGWDDRRMPVADGRVA